MNTSDRGNHRDPREHRQRQLIDAAWRQIESAASTVAGHSESKAELATSREKQHRPGPGPRRIQGYQIESEIHRGGQGVVYRAIQESTGKRVAIKVLLGGQFAGSQQLARFEREVRILAKMRHPNIVTIHDSGTVEGVAYFVMDRIEGHPLDVFLRDALPDRSRRLQLFASICRAVHAAHLHGVMHRDLKPSNILVDQDATPHILDFGLAKNLDDLDDPDEAMTRTGQFIGSLPWTSPEQALGHSDEIDIRTDVYSLGVILYQMLTDEFPYPVRGPEQDVVSAIVNQEPRPPGRDVDPDIATVALMALHKEPDRRYQSAGALGQDVERFLAGEPVDAKRSSILYLLRRRLARHKWVALLLTSLLASLIIGLFVSLSLWRMASRRAREAADAATRSEAVSEFLSRTLQSANPSMGGQAEMTVRETMERASAEL
ncbi:MAG TPA: serine/threonine-protein kinase, partial [Pirellulaceae bacterium]